MATMVNVNNILNVKDSRWLQLEVCREFQRNKCTRPDTECKFAHPPGNVEVQNGRVTACYDSIKGRCNREKPPCKYFHPPQHLKDQLLINGRNHLALKNALMQQMGLTPGQPLVTSQVPAVGETRNQLDNGYRYSWTSQQQSLLLPCFTDGTQANNPYLTGMPQVGSTFNPYFSASPLVPIVPQEAHTVGSPLGVVTQTVIAPQKVARSDRLEAFPGMVPYKRPAGEKMGMTVYQPNTSAYQQLMQLQQPFVPVSCEYTPATVGHTATASSPPPSWPPTLPPPPASSPPNVATSDLGSSSGESCNNDQGAKSPNAPSPIMMHKSHTKDTSSSLAMASMGLRTSTYPTSTTFPNTTTLATSLSPQTVLSYTGMALNKQQQQNYAASLVPVATTAAQLQQYQYNPIFTSPAAYTSAAHAAANYPFQQAFHPSFHMQRTLPMTHFGMGGLAMGGLAMAMGGQMTPNMMPQMAIPQVAAAPQLGNFLTQYPMATPAPATVPTSNNNNLLLLNANVQPAKRMKTM